MRVYIWLIALLCLCISCTPKVKVTSFNPLQFKETIRNCLDEPYFREQGSFDTNAISVYVIRTNYNIRDTLSWANKLFKINPLDTNYTREQLINVEFSFPSKKECLLTMRYTPGYSFSLVQEQRFKLEKGVWKLEFKNLLIQDGQFN